MVHLPEEQFYSQTTHNIYDIYWQKAHQTTIGGEEEEEKENNGSRNGNDIKYLLNFWSFFFLLSLLFVVLNLHLLTDEHLLFVQFGWKREQEHRNNIWNIIRNWNFSFLAIVVVVEWRKKN